MAKKLTNDLIEKMVLDVLNESNNVNEIFGAVRDFFGGGRAPTQTPSQMGIARGRAKSTLEPENDAIQFLQILSSDPAVPQKIKNQINNFLAYSPTPDKEEVPAEKVRSTPRLENPDIPVAPSGPAPVIEPMAGEPTAPMSRSQRAKQQKRVGGRFSREEAMMYESLIAEVLAEMAKKGKKEPKQEPKKTGKK